MGKMAMEKYLANCAFGNFLYFETLNAWSLNEWILAVVTKLTRTLGSRYRYVQIEIEKAFLSFKIAWNKRWYVVRKLYFAGHFSYNLWDLSFVILSTAICKFRFSSSTSSYSFFMAWRISLTCLNAFRCSSP